MNLNTQVIKLLSWCKHAHETKRLIRHFINKYIQTLTKSLSIHTETRCIGGKMHLYINTVCMIIIKTRITTIITIWLGGATLIKLVWKKTTLKFYLKNA